MRTALKAYTPAGNLQSPSYARVVNISSRLVMSWTPNLFTRSFKYCEVTFSNLANKYGGQLRIFFRTSEFGDDLEEIVMRKYKHFLLQCFF
jgi:hypothetical protein